MLERRCTGLAADVCRRHRSSSTWTHVHEDGFTFGGVRFATYSYFSYSGRMRASSAARPSSPSVTLTEKVIAAGGPSPWLPLATGEGAALANTAGGACLSYLLATFLNHAEY